MVSLCRLVWRRFSVVQVDLAEWDAFRPGAGCARARRRQEVLGRVGRHRAVAVLGRRQSTAGDRSASAAAAAARGGVAERVAEVLRRVVVDDGIDARVEVGEAVPEDAHRRVPARRRRVAEEGDEQMDVDRQPEKSEYDDDEDEQHAGSFLLLRRSAQY